MPAQTSAESPLPVRTVARMIGDYIARLGRVWIEGQVTELRQRPGSATVFLVLRDPVANVSLPMSCNRAVLGTVVPPLADGARVVVDAKPDFWLQQGRLTLTAFEIRPVGVGELLARLERLKAQLTAEGLFAAERKKRLPFLPRTVGLICGRESAAERDVVETARRRWPGVAFRIKEVAVQGGLAVEQVTDALRALDRDPDVDVIVIARGGGSTEDLLPFSDESLVRAVAAAATPVVSAIGHEPDSPLLDHVADVRAATPTDAGRRVVPDVGEELARVHGLLDRATRVVRHRHDAEQRWLAQVRQRPSLAAPDRALGERTADVVRLRARADRCVRTAYESAVASLAHASAQVRALSPQATLDRGYAVVQRREDDAVVRDPAEAPDGTALRLRVAGGEVPARSGL
ncbi:MAG TPA: exodeoxyribonuclease VII large subunit [Mycobacteriales bacterium]|nr:exodeoxyribonuclease VII large subunit [Mycobacteriales bacterium]